MDLHATDDYTTREVAAYELGAYTVFKILKEQMIEHCTTLEEALKFIDDVERNLKIMHQNGMSKHDS